MTNKQRILQMVERWPENISYDQAVYHMWVLKKIDAGLKSLETGSTIDHDELFDELEQLCDEEESQARVVGAGKRGPNDCEIGSWRPARQKRPGRSWPA